MVVADGMDEMSTAQNTSRDGFRIEKKVENEKSAAITSDDILVNAMAGTAADHRRMP